MGTQLVLSFAKRLFFNLSNALNPKPNSQTIRILSPYRNISLFSLVFILQQCKIKRKIRSCDYFGKYSDNNVGRQFMLQEVHGLPADGVCDESKVTGSD